MTSLKQMKRRYMMSLWKNKNTGKEMANESIKLFAYGTSRLALSYLTFNGNGTTYR
jgi:poly(A) polymerase Pap1